MHFLQAINSDPSVLILCNQTGGTIKGDIKKSYSVLDEASVSIFMIEFEDSRIYFYCKSESHQDGYSSKSSDLYCQLSQFESQPAYQLASRRCFVIFVSPSRHFRDITSFWLRSLPFKSLPVNYSPITLPFQAQQSLLLSVIK